MRVVPPVQWVPPRLYLRPVIFVRVFFELVGGVDMADSITKGLIPHASRLRPNQLAEK